MVEVASHIAGGDPRLFIEKKFDGCLLSLGGYTPSGMTMYLRNFNGVVAQR